MHDKITQMDGQLLAAHMVYADTLNAELEQMRQANRLCELDQCPPAYSEAAFDSVRKRLFSLAIKLGWTPGN